MAGRLSHVASQIMGANGVVCRSVASSLRLRSGMGLPVGKHIVPDKPLPVNDELMWDNGTAYPEPCIDRIADTVGKYEALGWLCGGLSCFAMLGLLAVWNDKASKIPFVRSNLMDDAGGMERYDIERQKNQVTDENARQLGEREDEGNSAYVDLLGGVEPMFDRIELLRVYSKCSEQISVN
ncbi:unnamed protein product [Ilex paraguariensis]|uniref:NADH dehydrogenase [ubiquinone] 1 beta subcomplex subunit 8, mitochondrial n=1 Tax=Ilex paraguariensis TaxID=185542 RepID=A0ABC8ULS1_9AQUA